MFTEFQMDICKDDQIKSLAPFLKAVGFKKKRGSWHREQDDLIHVVNIQGSQWGADFYLNIGVYLKALGQESRPPEYRCHFRSRLSEPDKPVEELVEDVESWFSKYGTLADLAESHANGTLPLASQVVAVDFLARHNQ